MIGRYVHKESSKYLDMKTGSSKRRGISTTHQDLRTKTRFAANSLLRLKTFTILKWTLQILTKNCELIHTIIHKQTIHPSETGSSPQSSG
jgi:hypothetical protein